MDPLRTLLLARTQVVVLDADRIADAATRPSRDVDIEKFEDELAQLGFVMSLDLAMTMRRLTAGAVRELRHWMVTTLSATLGAHRPHVPLFRSFPVGTPGDTATLLLRRVISWLATSPNNPCPWCGEPKNVNALDPCGHLVCRTCWDGGDYAGCPICHRRVAMGDPFVKPQQNVRTVERTEGPLRLVHLAFDVEEVARARFTSLVARATPLSPADRTELIALVDTIGPRIARWLPASITVRETMADIVARLWQNAPDRDAIRAATAGHVHTATDVLRIAMVMMGQGAGLAKPDGKLQGLGRGLRRCVLAALDGIAPASLADDVLRHRGLWKRVGERLHPFEYAAMFPTAALAFAIVRNTDVTRASFGPVLAREIEPLPRVRVDRDRVRVRAWARPVEEALRAGDARTAVDVLAARPGELLRRVDHLVRVTEAAQPAALGHVLDAVREAVPHGPPAMLLTLATHAAARQAPWAKRVFFPKANALHAYGIPDARAPLSADAIGTIRNASLSSLVARADARSRFPRGVIDRGLVDLLAPLSERSVSRAKVAWPRGSAAPIPDGETLRLFLHWEEPVDQRVDLDLSVALYDEHWRYVDRCDFTNLDVKGKDGERAAIHSGDLTNGPAPLGASEFVDLDLARLRSIGARYAVMVVLSYNSVEFSRLVHGFAGLMIAPAEGTHFDARAVEQRFDLAGKAKIVVPLTVDLVAKRLRWMDVHLATEDALNAVGGRKVALAHLGADFEALAGSGARPTMFDVAAIHAAARANVIYVRERDGSIAQFRRRDRETSIARLARLHANDHDGITTLLPAVTAPTWFALLRDDLALPAGSEGYLLDARTTGPTVARLSAADLIAHLSRR